MNRFIGSIHFFIIWYRPRSRSRSRLPRVSSEEIVELLQWLLAKIVQHVLSYNDRRMYRR